MFLRPNHNKMYSEKHNAQVFDFVHQIVFLQKILLHIVSILLVIEYKHHNKTTSIVLYTLFYLYGISIIGSTVCYKAYFTKLIKWD